MWKIPGFARFARGTWHAIWIILCMLQKWHSSSICERPIIRSMNFDHLKKRHMNFEFEDSNSHICVFQFCTSICFDRGSTSIPWSKFRKARFHYLPQLGNFKFVDCWILKFVRTMRFLFPHFIIKLAPTWKWPIKTKIDDFDLKYPQRQGMVWKLQVHWNAPRGNKELIE